MIRSNLLKGLKKILRGMLIYFKILLIGCCLNGILILIRKMLLFAYFRKLSIGFKISLNSKEEIILAEKYLSARIKKYPLKHTEICKLNLLHSDVAIVYGEGSKYDIQCISDLTSEKIGSLVVCKAIVIRAT
jgi:hypothetical protein